MDAIQVFEGDGVDAILEAIRKMEDLITQREAAVAAREAAVLAREQWVAERERNLLQPSEPLTTPWVLPNIGIFPAAPNNYPPTIYRHEGNQWINPTAGDAPSWNADFPQSYTSGMQAAMQAVQAAMDKMKAEQDLKPAKGLRR